MADSTLPGLLLTGNHAGRPSATAVGSGALYSCSTHALVYQSNGATWSTWATLGTAGGLTHTYYGRTTTGGSWLGTTSARVYMKKITLASAGVLVSIAAHIRSGSADTSSLSVELFSDSGGNPSLLIGHSRGGVAWLYGDLKLSTSGAGTGRWIDFPMGGYLAAGDYWIAAAAWKNEGSNIDLAYDSSGGSDRYFDSSQTNGGHVLDPASVTSPSHNYSIRASVLT